MDEQHTSKVNPWIVSTFVLVGLIVGFGIAQIPYFKALGGTSTASSLQPSSPSPPAAQTPPTATLSTAQIAALADDDPIIGDPKAPVTVVEFSDFQCPYCSRFFTATFGKIEENYIKSGKVKFVYRDFPLADKHPQAILAAEAAQCANDQSKFKEMHDQLFLHQELWAGVEKPKDAMKKFATTIGLDVKQFTGCLESNKYKAEIQKDLVDGSAVGVNGTPSFFVNGKFVEGAVPYELVFKPILDAELSGKKWELQFDPTGRPSVKVE